MKILKAGDINRIDNIRHFECKDCGCVFEADKSEYHQHTDFRNSHYYVIQCPTCGKHVVAYPEDEAKWK